MGPMSAGSVTVIVDMAEVGLLVLPGQQEGDNLVRRDFPSSPVLCLPEVEAPLFMIETVPPAKRTAIPDWW